MKINEESYRRRELLEGRVRAVRERLMYATRARIGQGYAAKMKIALPSECRE